MGAPLNLLLQKIRGRNPVTIIALTALAALAVTIAFYPGAVLAVLPYMGSIQPWMIKIALYLTVQTTVAGIGLRAYGRFQNTCLCQQWENGEIHALFIGARRHNQEGIS